MFLLSHKKSFHLKKKKQELVLFYVYSKSDIHTVIDAGQTLDITIKFYFKGTLTYFARWLDTSDERGSNKHGAEQQTESQVPDYWSCFIQTTGSLQSHSTEKTKTNHIHACRTVSKTKSCFRVCWFEMCNPYSQYCSLGVCIDSVVVLDETQVLFSWGKFAIKTLSLQNSGTEKSTAKDWFKTSLHGNNYVVHIY